MRNRPIRYSRPAVPCRACYRPLTTAERQADAGQYCAACRESGAAARHAAAPYRNLEASP